MYHHRFCPDKCFHCVMHPTSIFNPYDMRLHSCPWQLAAYQINKVRIDGIAFTFEESSYHAQALGKKWRETDMAWRKRLDAAVVEKPDLPAACRFTVRAVVGHACAHILR